ncbi:GntR family transcriptional regulator [Ruthenibacterium lactatiformans]|uniref:GntR family transcriptional regulator n=1 Tax=Ruthenibacterium lactatiformans TaxID=1550024 RepID=UPI00307CA685
MPEQDFPYKIDRTSIVPLYYQLKMCILELIQSGRLQEGDIIAPESELCEKLNISRPTARQCLNELVAEGYLTRQRGRGTYVAKEKINARFLNKLHTFGEEIRASGMTPHTRVLFFGHVAGSAVINSQLEIQPKDSLIHLRRLRCANEEPILIQDTYLAYEKYKNLLEFDFNQNSLYDVLEFRFGTCVKRVRRSIHAGNATAKEAKLLEVKTGMALCVVVTTALDAQGVPVEYTVSHYRGDKVKFSVELYR